MSAQGSHLQGFSLVEVLVTLTIVSVGLLGVVGFQTNTQKISNNAYYQTQAVIITHDMTERIRANTDASDQKKYHLTQARQAVNCRKRVGCNALSMSQNDLFEWNQMIKQQLPQGSGVVCIDSTPNDGKPSTPVCDNQGSQYAIKLWWHDSSANKIQRSVITLRTD